jgi:hypothetical protein
MIKKVSVQDMDNMLSNNQELQDLMLRNAEYIRMKNMDYFEKKKKFWEEKRELDKLEAEKIMKLDEKESKNDQSRKAAVTLDPACEVQRKYVQETELELEAIEQDLWTLRHLESNFKMIAELRIIELKKTV